jgi:hypothetical protein
VIAIDDPKDQAELELQLQTSFEKMMKAGSGKFTD